MGFFFKSLSKRDWVRIVISLLIIIISTWISLLIPGYSRLISEQISDGTATIESIKSISWLVLFLNAFTVVCSVICGVIYSRLSASFGTNLRELIFNKVSELEDNSVNKITVGSLLTRTNGDVSMMQFVLLSFLQVGFQAPLTAVWALIKIQKTNTMWLGSMAICIAVLAVIIFSVIFIVLPYARRLRNYSDEFNTVIGQGLAGVRVLRAFNVEDYQKERNDGISKKLTGTAFAYNRLANILSPAISLCNGALSVLIYWIGIYLMVRTSSAGRVVIIGNMAAFSQYSAQIIGAFMSFVSIFAVIPEALISIRRIGELFKEKTTVNFPEEDSRPSFGHGLLEITNADYTYAGTSCPSLCDINLTVNKGEIIGITGPTGCGKTTLLNLIRRNIDADKGLIKVNRNDYRRYSEETMSKIMSFAPQRDMLIAASAGLNICYGSSVDTERINKVADVTALDFLGDEGFDYRINQGGTNLSGGQRQRLCLARALYKKADFYLLDDSFSALDTVTEKRVLTNIRSICDGATVIMVSQRVSTLRYADRIAVMKDGHIEDIGTFNELYARNDSFSELVNSQNGGEVIL